MPNVDTTLTNRPVWFDLSTTDLDGAKAFYADIFGWSLQDFGPEMGHYNIASVGDRPAAGLSPKMPGQESTPSAWTVNFGVSDAAAALARINANGGRTIVEPMQVSDVGTMAIAQDPDGAFFGLWQADTFGGAAIEGEHGAMAWCEVNSKNAEGNAAFYGKVFDLSHSKMEGVPETYFIVNQGEVPVAGVMQMTESWGDIPPHWMPYFAVNKIADADAVVKKHGGTFLHGPIPSPYGNIMFVQDPQGAAFAYISEN